jgi:transglutaminase-like putative cysteine protease
MQRLHADFKYRKPQHRHRHAAGPAFEQRRGVCQDFAHLMAGAMRMLGLPVRYVSGYLLTRRPRRGRPAGRRCLARLGAGLVPGHPRRAVGAGGAGWLDLDPTNDLVPGTGHVRLAVGRDFGDVTPLRGVIRGGGRHTLSVAVRTRVIDQAGP